MSRTISDETGHSISTMSRHISCGVKNCPISTPSSLRHTVVAGKVGLFEVVQPSDTGIAVVDALRRNEVLAGVYGEKYLLVDFGTHTLRYLLGDDGIHDFICLSLKMKTPRKDCLTGCCVNLIMVSFLLG